MSMKKFNLMMWQGLVLSALALGFASCEPSDTPCPNRKEANSTTDQGVTVMLEMENVETGETTRTALGESNYSFTPYEAGAKGDVQALGFGFKPKPDGKDDIDVQLTYYAKENVVFQGWSWRYADDPRGTERGKTQDDKGLVSAPALQPESGVQKLDLGADKTSFTCKYREDRDNRVYVKVRYAFFSPQLELPELPPLVPDTETVCGYCHREPDYGDCDCPEARQKGTWWIEIEVPNPLEADYASCVREYKENRTLSNYKQGIDVWNEASNYFLHSR